MASAVRAGDVYIVPIRGDNGVVKPRRVVILDGAPNPQDPLVVLLIFGCSDTNAKARPGTYVRVFDDDADFVRLALANSTTFHLEDIRFYDANSPVFARPPIGRCGDPDRMLQFRELLEARLEDRTPIKLLPATASDESEEAATEYRRRALASTVDSVGDERGIWARSSDDETNK